MVTCKNSVGDFCLPYMGMTAFVLVLRPENIIRCRFSQLNNAPNVICIHFAHLYLKIEYFKLFFMKYIFMKFVL